MNFNAKNPLDSFSPFRLFAFSPFSPKSFYPFPLFAHIFKPAGTRGSSRTVRYQR